MQRAGSNLCPASFDGSITMHIQSIAVPFHSAEEAWFWHLRACEFAGKPRSMWPQELTTTPRPCEPHEVFKALCDAYRNGPLNREHLELLNRSTMDGFPYLTEADHLRWDFAMAALERRLRAKGIVQ